MTEERYVNPLQGRAADRSLVGRVRWLVELLEQIPPEKLAQIRGGSAVATALADTREALDAGDAAHLLDVVRTLDKGRAA